MNFTAYYSLHYSVGWITNFLFDDQITGESFTTTNK